MAQRFTLPGSHRSAPIGLTPIRWTLLPLIVCGASAPLALPLRADVAQPLPLQCDASLVGPRTEPVDRTQYAKVLHVSPGGAPDADGSAGKPFATIARAMAEATGAQQGSRIALLIAAGRYGDAAVEMHPYVDLYGGFHAADWRRDVGVHASVLDGQGERRVVVAANNARIDGFVIANGKVHGPGAGILCDHASPVITNNVIVDNMALAPPGLAESAMLHQTGHEGGGIACLNGSSPAIWNNVVARNRTGIGGGAGIAASNWSMPQIVSNVISGNESGIEDKANSRSSNGAAVSASKAMHRPPMRMRIVNNVISGNRTGAQSKSDAGGIYLEYDSSPVIAANWLLGNWSADDGSALYSMKASHPRLVGNVVAGNNASAIRLSKEGRGDVAYNLLFANANPLTCISSWMLMHNNTIVDNLSGVGYENSYAPHLKPSVISRNLIYGNQGGSGLNGGQQVPDRELPIVDHNDIEGGYPAGDGNFDQKPSFVNDALAGEALRVEYDKERVVTTLIVENFPASRAWGGRVVNLGDRWGVIVRAAEKQITVWGDLTSSEQGPTAFKIWPTYALQSSLGGDVVAGAGSMKLDRSLVE